MLSRLRYRLINKKQRKVLNYLYQKLSQFKYKNKSLSEYFDAKYIGNCYFYSTYMFLCLQENARLVRGSISLEKSQDKPNYHHGWVEFEFNGEWYVYDDHYYYPIPIDMWYKIVTPYEIDVKFTHSELIDYICDNFKTKVDIQEKDNIKTISTEYIWDEKFKIPFMYLDMSLVGNKIINIHIDKDDIYVQYVRNSSQIDWC